MTEGVKVQETAEPERKASGDKDYNFRRLEEEKNRSRENEIRLEMQNQMLQKELSEIKEYLKPKEADPFEGIDDLIEPELKQRLEAKINKVSSNLERKAEEIAERKIEERERKKAEAEKSNFLQKLQKDYSDYDQVMSDQNIADFAKADPDTLKIVLALPDEYEKRRYLYSRIKGQKAAKEPTVQDKVQKNLKNPYFVPSSAAPTSNAIDYDLNAPGARAAAYQKLKVAQKQK